MEEKSGRVFLLSPANVAGKRAKMLLNPNANFELAQRLRTGDGVPLGEAFAFMSGLYFRGKLAYARAFAVAPDGCAGVLIITSNSGLVSADALVTPADLQAYCDVPIDARENRYTQPLVRDAAALAASCANDCSVVVLGSVASGKYVDHCAPRAADEEMCLVRCATAQPMREEKAPRDRLAGAGPKSPSAAVVKSHGREHGRKRSGNGSDQIGNREMNESEPLMTCRNVYQMRSKPGGSGCPGISMDETCFGPCGLRHEGGMTLLRGGSVERGNLPHRW